MASEQKIGDRSGAATSVCGDCGKRCAGPAFLQQHITKMHLTEYSCETEGCTFTTKDRKLFKAHTHSKETKAAVSKPKASTDSSGKSGSRKRTSTSALSQLYVTAGNPVAEALDNLLGGKKAKMGPENEEEDELLDISDDDENDTDYEEVEEEEDDEEDDDDAEDKDEDEEKEEEEDDDLKKLKEFINSLSSLPGKASAFYKLTKKLKQENVTLKKEQEAEAGKKTEDGNSPTEFQLEALAKHLSAEDLQKIREFKDHEWFNRAIMLVYAQALRDFNAK